MVGWEIYSVLYFEAAGKTVKGFGQGIACECMPRASPVTLFLSHCFMEFWDMWPNVGLCSHAQKAEAMPSDSYFPEM